MVEDSEMVPTVVPEDEEEVVFNDPATPGESPEPAFQSDEINAVEKDEAAIPAAGETSPSDSVNADYDFLDDGEDLGNDADNPELDELEAEILRELED